MSGEDLLLIGIGAAVAFLVWKQFSSSPVPMILGTVSGGQCPQSSCAGAMPTGTYDSNGCPVFDCPSFSNQIAIMAKRPTQTTLIGQPAVGMPAGAIS